MRYLVNAFSLGMIAEGVEIRRAVRLSRPPSFDGLVSIIGHQSTADILGVAFNRASVKLTEADEVVVAQYDGPRLPEGATTLPEGAKFSWWRITFQAVCPYCGDAECIALQGESICGTE